MEFIKANIYGKILTIYLQNDCMVIYTLGKYYSIDHAAKEWFEE